MSTASDFFSWSQNRYAWVTNNPTDVSDVTSSDVAQYEGDVSRLTGETKRPEEPLPWQNYFSSLYENNVLWAGGRGAMVVKMTADRNFYRRHRIAQEGSALANIDLRIIACAMGDMNWFVLSGYVCIFGVFLAYFWCYFGWFYLWFFCGFVFFCSFPFRIISLFRTYYSKQTRSCSVARCAGVVEVCWFFGFSWHVFFFFFSPSFSYASFFFPTHHPTFPPTVRYTFAPNNEDVQIQRNVRVYRLKDGGKWEVEKSVLYDDALAGQSVAATAGMFFVGNPTDTSITVFKEITTFHPNSKSTSWTPSAHLIFGGKGENAISNGIGFGSFLFHKDGLLAVSAPASVPHVDHVPGQPDNAGSVFVYNISSVDVSVDVSTVEVSLILGVNAPAEYLVEHHVKESGLMFGASVALSEVMADDTVFLFVGAPGSDGTSITNSKKFNFDGGGGALATFTLRLAPTTFPPESTLTHWFTGFLGNDDHDVGASVAYSDSASMLFYGAPNAANRAGAANALWGSGRVYIAAFCKENEEFYSYLHYQQYLRKCRSCNGGQFSLGGRDRCQSCSSHPNTMGAKPAHAVW